MGNKKGSLLTVFLVVAIILIIVMGALLYMQKTESDKQLAELENNASKLQETINDLQGKIDSISNTINDKDDTSLNEKNLKQFDNKFYEIDDIAKEYSDFNSIKNYKDFNYDLDGDGKIDKITLRHIMNEYDVLEYNGEKIAQYYHGSTIYIVDLNENDKNIEVVIYDAGPSDDPNYTIYSKSGDKMIELENIVGYPLKSDKNGTVLVEHVYSRVINPEIYFEYYIIQNGKIEIKNVDIEKIKNIEFKTSGLYFTKNYENKNKMDNELEDTLKKLEIEKLNENTTFKIIEFDFEDEEIDYGLDRYHGYKIKVKLSDGREGYVFYEQLGVG